jgi:hypothetical protein
MRLSYLLKNPILSHLLMVTQRAGFYYFKKGN